MNSFDVTVASSEFLHLHLPVLYCTAKGRVLCEHVAIRKVFIDGWLVLPALAFQPSSSAMLFNVLCSTPAQFLLMEVIWLSYIATWIFPGS